MPCSFNIVETSTAVVRRFYQICTSLHLHCWPYRHTHILLPFDVNRSLCILLQSKSSQTLPPCSVIDLFLDQLWMTGAKIQIGDATDWDMARRFKENGYNFHLLYKLNCPLSLGFFLNAPIWILHIVLQWENSQCESLQPKTQTLDLLPVRQAWQPRHYVTTLWSWP